MRDYNNSEERRYFLEDCIRQMDELNKKMSTLVVKKEELTDMIIGALGHEHEGQRSYEYNLWKIEVKTPCVYSLNKKLYESGQFTLPKKFNPIKQSTSYTIDKRMCDQYLIDAPNDVRDVLIELIDKKRGKASVTIKERTQ